MENWRLTDPESSPRPPAPPQACFLFTQPFSHDPTEERRGHWLRTLLTYLSAHLPQAQTILISTYSQEPMSARSPHPTSKFPFPSSSSARGLLALIETAQPSSWPEAHPRAPEDPLVKRLGSSCPKPLSSGNSLISPKNTRFFCLASLLYFTQWTLGSVDT